MIENVNLLAKIKNNRKEKNGILNVKIIIPYKFIWISFRRWLPEKNVSLVGNKAFLELFVENATSFIADIVDLYQYSKINAQSATS